jgi:tRNA1Val (adenine37-N6)-methyltransferase
MRQTVSLIYMPNDYFRFKQFTVKQNRCAMKVCTDACLFGAWAAHILDATPKHILDIGAGTGLLALPLAQSQSAAVIDAVEMDEAAAQQAGENFEASPWNENLHIYPASIQQFSLTAAQQYDVVISNPPFFENDLKSIDAKRNLALHSAALKLEELVAIAGRVMKADGDFFVLLPFHRAAALEPLLPKYHFYVREKVWVKQSEKHDWFRAMFWISRKNGAAGVSEITILNDKNVYSTAFTKLLKDYYLNI